MKLRSSRRLKRKIGPRGTEKYEEMDSERAPLHLRSPQSNSNKSTRKRFKKIRRFLGGRLRAGKKKQRSANNRCTGNATTETNQEEEEEVSLNSSFCCDELSDGQHQRQLQAGGELYNPRKSSISPSFNLSPILDKSGADDDDESFEDELYPGSASFLSSESDTLNRSFAAAPKKIILFKVVLLLVDPNTRRFELLHLEFDSRNVIVSEAISQVSGSVTEELLRKKSYSGVCCSDSIHRSGTERLSSFCRGNDVIVGIPSDSSAEEVVQLAIPILTDDKILKMFKHSGIDATSWEKQGRAITKKGKPTKTKRKPASAPTTSKKSVQIERSPENNNRLSKVSNIDLDSGSDDVSSSSKKPPVIEVNVTVRIFVSIIATILLASVLIYHREYLLTSLPSFWLHHSQPLTELLSDSYDYPSDRHNFYSSVGSYIYKHMYKTLC